MTDDHTTQIPLEIRKRPAERALSGALLGAAVSELAEAQNGVVGRSHCSRSA